MIINLTILVSSKKNTSRVDFNNKLIDNVHSIKINSFPALEEQLTPKSFVDQAISEGLDDSSLLRLDLNEKSKLDERGYMLPNSTLTSPKTILEIPTEFYVDYKLDDPSITKKHYLCWLQ